MAKFKPTQSETKLAEFFREKIRSSGKKNVEIAATIDISVSHFSNVITCGLPFQVKTLRALVKILELSPQEIDYCGKLYLDTSSTVRDKELIDTEDLRSVLPLLAIVETPISLTDLIGFLCANNGGLMSKESALFLIEQRRSASFKATNPLYLVLYKEGLHTEVIPMRVNYAVVLDYTDKLLTQDSITDVLFINLSTGKIEVLKGELKNFKELQQEWKI